MAYVLSLRPHSPLKRSFSDNPYLATCSPLKESFLVPFGDLTTRNTSACSLYTLGSHRSSVWAHGIENTPPLTSQSLLNLVPENQAYDISEPIEQHAPRKRTCGIDRATPSLTRTPAYSSPTSKKKASQNHAAELPPSVENGAEGVDMDNTDTEETELLNLYEAIHVPLPEGRFSDNTAYEQGGPRDIDQHTFQTGSQPFRRWVSTLRRRHLHRRKKQDLSFDGGKEVLPIRKPVSMTTSSVRRTSDSITSSMGFVTTVKTTSITIGSASIPPTSEKGPQGKFRMGNRSSNTDARRSMESHRGGLGPVIDESAWLRSLQRRKVVEELIASEESYIADLKVLINVERTCQISPASTDMCTRTTS